MTRTKEILKEAEKAASANTQIIGDWGEHYLGFIHGAEWADAHPHWISVEDELPPTSDRDDESEDCLIVDEDGDMNVGYYNKMDKTWFSCDGYILGVTHWMPLPQPPKKGGEK